MRPCVLASLPACLACLVNCYEKRNHPPLSAPAPGSPLAFLAFLVQPPDARLDLRTITNNSDVVWTKLVSAIGEPEKWSASFWLPLDTTQKRLPLDTAQKGYPLPLQKGHAQIHQGEVDDEASNKTGQYCGWTTSTSHQLGLMKPYEYWDKPSNYPLLQRSTVSRERR